MEHDAASTGRSGEVRWKTGKAPGKQGVRIADHGGGGRESPLLILPDAVGGRNLQEKVMTRDVSLPFASCIEEETRYSNVKVVELGRMSF